MCPLVCSSSQIWKFMELLEISQEWNKIISWTKTVTYFAADDTFWDIRVFQSMLKFNQILQ